MNPSARLACFVALVAVGLGVAGAFLLQRTAPGPAAPETTPDALLHAPADTLPPEEIFRRAFWRQPSADDHILHAERRETRSESAGVERWQWFIAVRPSADLLDSLRSPETFGLLPVTRDDNLRPWPVEPRPAPDWFPKLEAASEFQVLQNPATGFTVLHDVSENRLFATDNGAGFAPAAR